MSRKETKDFTGGFNPSEVKTNLPRGRTETLLNWQGSFDRKESISDPMWLKRPPNKGEQMKNPKPPN